MLRLLITRGHVCLQEAKNRILAIVATQVRQQPENAARTSEGPDANMDPQTVVATLMQVSTVNS